MRITFYFILILIGCSCGHRSVNNQSLLPSTGENIPVKYARGFSITQAGNIKILRVYNPWEGAKGVEYTYVLCPHGKIIPDSLKRYQVIYTPVKKVVCLSTTYVALLSFIGELNTITGVASPGLVSDTLVRKMVSEGKVSDVGFDQALNYEVLISLKPDLVFAYGIQGETATQYKKLEDLGIKVILNGEYLESNPLGKMEWVKFLASFYETTENASQKFEEVEKEYLHMASLCENLKNKPRVMCGLPWKGSWYVPGGNSYLAKMIGDAGGDYLWKDLNQRESIPLNFEKVIERAGEADIWINTGLSGSLQDIAGEDNRLLKVRPLMEKRVFNNNARMNSSGGNDFWESGITHPQIILEDLIKIFHPDLLPGHSLVYYKKLN